MFGNEEKEARIIFKFSNFIQCMHVHKCVSMLTHGTLK